MLSWRTSVLHRLDANYTCLSALNHFYRASQLLLSLPMPLLVYVFAALYCLVFARSPMAMSLGHHFAFRGMSSLSLECPNISPCQSRRSPCSSLRSHRHVRLLWIFHHTCSLVYLSCTRQVHSIRAGCSVHQRIRPCQSANDSEYPSLSCKHCPQ